MANRTPLRGVSDVRRYFHQNREPTYFISATSFNLLGMDEWVGNFKFINYIDCFDGHHPNVICPREIPHDTFASIEDINNYLLSHPDVRKLIHDRGPGGRAVFLMFDEKTEALCEELGLTICFPSAGLRAEVDHKVGATRLGDRAGVASVPNILANVDSYATLRRKAKDLGDHLVIQTPFGDSGHTTFFISREEDYASHAGEIETAGEVKVMKRIRAQGSALEACVTRHGTIVGPLMTELVGFPELTPYRGGWCGNEVYAGAFSDDVRRQAQEKTFALGEELRKKGYRGYFEVDYLTDLDTGELYMGEINPRITGVSSLTNLAAFAHADAPLFVFHLLEYSGAPFELEVQEINARWADPDNIDSWGQLVIKHLGKAVEVIDRAPPSGVWELTERGEARLVRVQTHRRAVQESSRAFFLRVSRPGDFLYEGADLGILVAPGRMMTDDGELTERARAWIDAIRPQFTARDLRSSETPTLHVAYGGIK